MRECPRCHFIDPPNWRCPPFGPDFDYVRYDEFQELLPELAREIAKGGVVFDELHAYRRTKTGKYVYRVWKPIWKAYGGDSRSWADVRRTKMYDSAGRLNKKAWSRMLNVMGKRIGARKTSITAQLDSFNGEVIPQKPEAKT